MRKYLVILGLIVSLASFGQNKKVLKLPGGIVFVVNKKVFAVPPSPPPEDTLTQYTLALLSRMTSQPVYNRIGLIDDVYQALYYFGLDDYLDAYYLGAAHDSQASTLNWMGDTNNLSFELSSSFKVDTGWVGDGTGYINTHYNPYQEGTLGANNGEYTFYFNSVSGTLGRILWGHRSTTAPASISYLQPRKAATTTDFYGHNSNSTDLTLNPIVYGNWSISISDSTYLHINDSIYIQTNISNGVYSDYDYHLLAYNYNGVATLPITANMQGFAISKNLPDYLRTKLMQITEYYMDSVGQGVNDNVNITNIDSIMTPKPTWQDWFDTIWADFILINDHIPADTLTNIYRPVLEHVFSTTYPDSSGGTGYYWDNFWYHTKADFFIIMFDSTANLKALISDYDGNDVIYNKSGKFYLNSELPVTTYGIEDYLIVSKVDNANLMLQFDAASQGHYRYPPSFYYADWGLTRFYVDDNKYKCDITNYEFPNNLSAGFQGYNCDFTGIADITTLNTAFVDLYNNDLSGVICDSNNMGATRYDFDDNTLETRYIDTFFFNMNRYYRHITPTKNVTVDFSGLRNGYLTGGASNADLTELQSTFTGAGYTLTATYNSDGNELTQGYIAFSFDDGNKSDVDTVLALFESYGWVATSYVTGANIGSGPTWMDTDDLDTLAAHGWDLQGHSWTHPYYTLITKEQVGYQEWRVDSMYAAEGLTDPTSMAYPHGAYNATVIDTVNDYNLTARTTTAGFIDLATAEYEMPSVNVDMQSYNEKLREAKLWVDAAVNKKVIVALASHSVDNTDYVYTCKIEYLIELLDYVQSKGVTVITMGQINGIINP